jgi:surface polysaccharide O-acyltransferase-like enzyme
VEGVGELMKEKYVYRDLIKIIATFLVMYNHTSDYGWTLWITMEGIPRVINLVFSLLCRIGVPLFFMVSGANLLGKQESFGLLFKKRILKWVSLIVLVSIAQYTYNVGFLGGFDKMSFKGWFQSLYGSYSYVPEFLWSYLLFLLLLPLLRMICTDVRLCEYTSYTWFILFEALPLLEFFFNFGGGLVLRNAIDSGLYFWVFPLVGYCLDKTTIETRKKSIIAITSLICLVASVLRVYIFYSKNSAIGGYNYSLSLSILTFVLCKSVFEGKKLSKRWSGMISAIGGLSLGTFLLSGIVQWKVFAVYLWIDRICGAQMAALLWMIVTVLVSQVITLVIKQIPVVKSLL